MNRLLAMSLVGLATFGLANCGSDSGSSGSTVCAQALDAADDVIEIATDGLDKTGAFFTAVGNGGDLVAEAEKLSSWMQDNTPRASESADDYHDLAVECRKGS